MDKIPFAHVRRQDRAVEDEAWIRALLRRAPVGVLATVCEGRPYLNTNLFAFDESQDVIYTHSAPEGRLRANVEGDGQVCFTVSEMGRLLPAATAKGVSVEYASVVAHGRAEIVTDPDEAARALQMLLDKYLPHLEPGRDYRSIQPHEVAVTSVYRIRIHEWSGKRKQAPDDFPGACTYTAKA